MLLTRSIARTSVAGVPAPAIWGWISADSLVSRTGTGPSVASWRWIAASAAAAGGEGAAANALPSIMSRLSADMKVAMKAKDTDRLSAIRFLNAAIKQHEIELRQSGTPLTDGEVVKVLQRSIKQRRDSIESYQAGGRQDLVDKETKELEVVQSYLPAMMSADAVQALVNQVVTELGATSQKDMGKVMADLKVRTEGRADNKLVSNLVKARLQGVAGKKA